MPQTLTPLSPVTTAGQSADIVVTTPTTIFLFTATGVFPSGVQCPVLRKKGSVYEPVTSDDGAPQFLTSERREITMTAPGTYAVSKPLTAFAVGVGADS